MNINFASFSESGPRARNEDSILAETFDDNRTIIAVADGLGGHFDGAMASSIAVDYLREKIAGENQVNLVQIFDEIHNEILSHQSGTSETHQMATTLTAAFIQGKRIVGAHCGDTRCSVLRGDGGKKLTIEHTEAQRLFEAGKLSKAELQNYPRKNILDSALGSRVKPRIDTFDFDLQLGDKVFISSDGFHEKIKLRELIQLVSTATDATQIVSKLKEEAYQRVLEDNMSLVVATFQ